MKNLPRNDGNDMGRSPPIKPDAVVNVAKWLSEHPELCATFLGYLDDTVTTDELRAASAKVVDSVYRDQGRGDGPLKEAIKRAGGVSALARELGVQRQAISQWRRAPPTRVLAIERLTGVSRFRLRPDVYPE